MAACISLTGGVAFDPQEGLLLTADQVVRYARDTESGVDKIEARLQGTNPH